MCKTNKKMYLRGTDKEICIGDEVTVSVKLFFKKYPSITHGFVYKGTVTEDTVKQLIENKIVYIKEDKLVEAYTTYLEWLADEEGMPIAEIFSAFSCILQVNPNAALSMLLKAISRKMNAKMTDSPRKAWLINNVTHKPYVSDIIDSSILSNVAWFITKEDAEYALKVCKPIINKYFNN